MSGRGRGGNRSPPVFGGLSNHTPEGIDLAAAA